MCVRGVDDLCVLQFTLVNATGCALHRRTSRVIHRIELYFQGFERGQGQQSLLPPHTESSSPGAEETALLASATGHTEVPTLRRRQNRVGPAEQSAARREETDERHAVQRLTDPVRLTTYEPLHSQTTEVYTTQVPGEMLSLGSAHCVPQRQAPCRSFRLRSYRGRALQASMHSSKQARSQRERLSER